MSSLPLSHKSSITPSQKEIQTQTIKACCSQLHFMSFCKMFNIWQLSLGTVGFGLATLLFVAYNLIIGPLLVLALSILHLTTSIVALVKYGATGRFTSGSHKVQAISSFFVGLFYCLVIAVFGAFLGFSVLNPKLLQYTNQLGLMGLVIFVVLGVPVSILNCYLSFLYMQVIGYQIHIEHTSNSDKNILKSDTIKNISAVNESNLDLSLNESNKNEFDV